MMTATSITNHAPYNHYSHFLRERYAGKRVYKIIVDAGFTCPNRDGNKGFGGCAYCNVDSFTPETRKLPSLQRQIEESAARARKNYKAEKFIVYFQPNTNTYADADTLKRIYDEALSVLPEDTVGLSVGTRPDCLDTEKVQLLQSYCHQGFFVDVEMGMESIYNNTLQQINRQCSHEDFVNAIDLLNETPVEVCVHTIFGLPGENRKMMLKYIDEINRLAKIRYIKFHHLHIVSGSILGVKYQREPFPLFSLEEYTDLLCEMLPRLRPDVVIQRLFGISDPEVLIAPKWNLKKSQIQNYIEGEIRRRNIVQGSGFINIV